eukprot:jgi/Galph1/3547/GphlegSOOS_G2232.1
MDHGVFPLENEQCVTLETQKTNMAVQTEQRETSRPWKVVTPKVLSPNTQNIAATWSPQIGNTGLPLMQMGSGRHSRSSSSVSSEGGSHRSIPSEEPPRRSISVLASSIQNLGRRYLPHDVEDEDEEKSSLLVTEHPNYSLQRSVTLDMTSSKHNLPKLSSELSAKVASVRGIKGSRRSHRRDALRAMIEAENKWQPAVKRYMVPHAETIISKPPSSPTFSSSSVPCQEVPKLDNNHHESNVDALRNEGNFGTKKTIFESEVPVAAYICEYNQTKFREEYVEDLAAYFNKCEEEVGVIRWIHIDSECYPQPALALLDSKYRLHPLAIEDVCYTPQRPKIDRYDWMLFIVAHYPQLKDEPGGLELSLNQVSIFFLKPSNVVITVEEPSPSGTRGRWSHVVRERLTFSTDDIRNRDLSFLVYSVLDALIDSYFPILEFYGERIEELEGKELIVSIAALMDEPNPDLIKGINRLKRDMFTMRRNTWPLRDMFSRLISLPEVGSTTKMYLRDCFDHIIQIIDILEVYRDSSMGLIDIYLSGANNKMQEVMKTLTIISTIFIPLTFITGVYGMNFSFMPELQYDYGYLFFW